MAVARSRSTRKRWRLLLRRRAREGKVLADRARPSRRRSPEAAGPRAERRPASSAGRHQGADRPPQARQRRRRRAGRGRDAWLGREDSNLRMAESKSAALPLGYAPKPFACARHSAARSIIERKAPLRQDPDFQRALPCRRPPSAVAARPACRQPKRLPSGATSELRAFLFRSRSSRRLTLSAIGR